MTAVNIGTLFAALYSVAIPWCVLVSGWRLIGYARTPQPWPVPLMPAPRTRLGVIGRLALETLAFRSLWRGSRITWVSSILFHYGLLLILCAHARFFFERLPPWMLPVLVGASAGMLAMMGGLAVLLARRLLVDRIRYISLPSDYLYLVLLLAVGASGSALKRLWPADLAIVGQFVRGVVQIDWQPLPAHPVLLVHLSLVWLLLMLFPLGKLLHGPALYFSPTWHQRDPGAGGAR